MIPDIKTVDRTMILPSTGEEIIYKSMGASVEREIGRIKNAYKRVFSDIAKKVSKKNGENSITEEKAKDMIAVELQEQTHELILALKPCFPDLDFTKLTEGDIEMMQIHLKKRCVDDQLELQVKCPECGGRNDISVDLNDITVKETKKTYTFRLEDESKLTIRHIPFLTVLNTIKMENDVTDVQYNYIVNSFVSLQPKGSEEVIDLSNMSYVDKVDWAFTRDNVRVEQLEQIIDFLDEESPSINPISSEISCKNRLYGDQIVTMDLMQRLSDQDGRNREKALEDGNDDMITEISKIKSCGHKYNFRIYSLTEYVSFF